MKRLCLLLALLALATSAEAQRRFRIGPVASVIALDEGGGTENFTSLGATLALLSGQDTETGFTVSRYADLSSSACERSLTALGLDSYYYPIGADGVAPFASGYFGLARVTDEDPDLLFGTCLPAQPSTEFGVGFGLGVRVNFGGEMAGIVEGRFFQVPNSAIQALEARANVSLAFGKPRAGEFLAGTVGPSIGFWIPVSGPLQGRAPFFGVRFRRDARKAGTVGLQIDYAPLEIVENCTADCEPYAIFFAPGYEASVHPRWGRLYGGLGGLVAGFPAEGPDRGVTQGLHAGIGADIYAGARTMVNVNVRVVWWARNSDESVFGVQLGCGLSAKLVHPKATGSP